VTDILDVVHFVTSNPLQRFAGDICPLELERREKRTFCGLLFVGKVCSGIYVNIDLNYVLLTQYCAGGKIETNEMGRACGTYGGGERCAQGVGGEA
jgi:hypothetical protein